MAFTYGALAPHLLWDADIGWHIRDGQNILTTHAIPRTDSFSATMSGRPWYAWEWLYDLGIGFIYNHLGLNGVVFFSAVVIALTLALVFHFALLRGGSVPVTVVFFLMCTVASSIHFLARPHVVGWLITVVWFWVLDSSYRNGRSQNHRLWGLPLLMPLWVNLHGGFVMGFVLIGIFLLADLLKLRRCRDAEERKTASRHAGHLGLIFGVSALASLMNPYGYKLHVHVFHYLTDRFLMQHIDEFRRPNFHGLPPQFFLLLLLLTIVGIAAARARLRWTEWLLILLSAASGLYAARNIPVAAMLLTMIAPPLFSRGEATQRTLLPGLRGFASRMDRMEMGLRGHLWPVLLLLLSTWICLHQGRFLGKQVMDAHFDATRFPVQAVEALQQRGERAPIFSLDSWGGYLIYRLYPETKVFIDDRHDFYGDPYLKDYLKILHVEPGWNQVLDKLGVNVIVVPAKSKLGDALQHDPGWKATYHDEVAKVFERVRSRLD
ncbi:MAG TPA: hypothetical protein VEV41_03685 [Terriglobales bacterium]|nr:hypothetical protein [Terriglobales bacterium]